MEILHCSEILNCTWKYMYCHLFKFLLKNCSKLFKFKLNPYSICISDNLKNMCQIYSSLYMHTRK